MKEHYPFLPKNWLRAGLLTVFASAFSFGVLAQNAPAMQWDKTFGGSAYDGLTSLQQTLDGGFILGGSSESGISGDKSQASWGVFYRDYWILKLDGSGNKLWDKSFSGSENDELNSLQQTSDGGYILGGYSNSNISGDKSQASKGGYDFWIVKIDA